MPVSLLFVIGSPRSGTTLLERMLDAHPAVQGGPEPHLLTPLAHLGVWNQVDKAPYDHVLAAESQKLFVSKLPNGEEDYWKACRAYCNVLYGQYMAGSAARLCLDKTPAYALILPFVAKVFPDANYVVLTRHPAAIFASYANSFFGGDYAAAQAYNPILNRYAPALAAFLRQDAVPFIHVRYEDLVADPASGFRAICDHLGIPFEESAIAYGASRRTDEGGLGDPIGVNQHDRPTTASVDKWARELAADPAKRDFVRGIVDSLDPADLATLGYPPESLWAPLEAAGGATQPKPPRLSWYRIQRKLIVGLRGQAQRRPLFRKALQRARLVCDVLLRE
ncbi:MAG: sulfotransferase [Candidatus Hydrogenedentes bacterium]|nr:sulfotransferase [Candidatus Hydrogenedentota bacterium]